MMLGSDVSSLSTTAANAAAQGLSIVVPLYNEAAGLALLHERLGGLAVVPQPDGVLRSRDDPLQASTRDDHGLLCRNRRVIGILEHLRC